jgi:hypothetical protein
MKYFFIFLTLFIYLKSFSQFNDDNANVWYFGNYCGIDFNSGTPSALTNGALIQGEGCATVCDDEGSLNFYTNGQTIWNRNHEIMPNGNDLMGSISATQSALIVKKPYSKDLYYVFTVDALENQLQNGLRYSVVDMNLDNTNGDVNDQKNILLDVPVCEKITAVRHQNQYDVWLIAHRWESDEFLVYLIDSNGVHDPIVQAIGSVHEGGYSSESSYNGWTNSIGYMKASINGQRIACAIHRANIIELYSFRDTDGQISDYFCSPAEFPDAYGVEFSPDGSKLYVTQTITSRLCQFDLNTDNLMQDYVEIATPNYQPSALQLGPEGKVYVSELNNSYLSVINEPDSSGLACNYISNGVHLAGRTCRRGLPSLFYYKGFQFVDKDEIEYKNQLASIYPNPINNISTIQLKGCNEAEIEIYNSSNQSIYKDYISVKENNSIPALNQGMYFVKISTPNRNEIHKIIKQ